MYFQRTSKLSLVFNGRVVSRFNFLQIFRRIRADGTEVRIPFLVDNPDELKQTIIAEIKPSNYFELLPIATSDLVKMSNFELTLKVIGTCDHMTLNRSQLDHFAAILKLTSKGPEREPQIRIATRKGQKVILEIIHEVFHTVCNSFFSIVLMAYS